MCDKYHPLVWNFKKLTLQFWWFWRQNCAVSWCACPCVLYDKTESGLLLAQAVKKGGVSDLWQNHSVETEGSCFGFGFCLVHGLFIWLVGWFLFGVLLLIGWGFLCLLRKSAIPEWNSVYWEIDLKVQYLLHFELEIYCKAYFNWCASTEVCSTMINLKEKYFLKKSYWWTSPRPHTH